MALFSLSSQPVTSCLLASRKCCVDRLRPPLILVSTVLVCGLFAEARVEKNVIYGMYSGLALLMDIHYPEQPNGYGVIHISGSG